MRNLHFEGILWPSGENWAKRYFALPSSLASFGGAAMRAEKSKNYLRI
jgi:hypothetical protein